MNLLEAWESWDNWAQHHDRWDRNDKIVGRYIDASNEMAQRLSLPSHVVRARMAMMRRQGMSRERIVERMEERANLDRAKP